MIVGIEGYLKEKVNRFTFSLSKIAEKELL